VDNGDNAINASDVPISPRQQITSTAFALHAKVADGIASSTDLTINPLSGTASNYGLGWYGTGRLFDSVAVDGPVLYGNSGGALGSSASGTKKTALLWNATGQVGIGATGSFAASNKLTLQGDDAATPAQQLVIRGNTDTTERLNIGFDTTGNKASLQSYTAAATAGNLLLNPSGGNVGIGSATAPAAKLSIGNPIYGDANTLSSSFVTNAGTLGTAASSELLLGNFGFGSNNSQSLAISAYRTAAGTTWVDTALILGMNVDVSNRPSGNFISIHANGNVGIGHAAPGFKLSVAGNAYVEGAIHAGSDIYMSSGRRLANGDGALYLSTLTAQPTVFQNNGVETMRISATGNVGINNATPGFPLTMASSLGDKIALYSGTASTSYGFGIQGGLLQIHTDSSASDVAFGHGSSAAMVETMRIKGNGNVGIGTASPAYKLDVTGTARVSQNLTLDSQLLMAESACIYGKNTSGVLENVFWPRASNGTYLNHGINGFYIRDNGSNIGVYINGGKMAVGGITDTGQGSITTNNGFVAMGTANNGNTSYAKMSYRADRGGLAFDVYNTGQFPNAWRGFSYDGDSNLDWYSDRTMKKDIVDAEPMLDRLMQLPFRRFHWKDVSDPAAKTEFGVIAQEVEPLFPDIVATGSDGMKTVGYTTFATIACKALQEYKTRTDADLSKLNEQIHERDTKIEDLEAKLAEQEKRATAQADEVTSQNARLVALEKLMSKAGAPETVSIKLGEP
jgi:hypothetical protein